MSLIESLKAGARSLDQALASVSLRIRRERPGVLAFLFHALFENQREVERGLISPYQPIVVDDLKRLIEYFLGQGYRFIAPADLLGDLRADGYYALITFDDGYANNLRAWPLMRMFGVPATFFVSTNHVAAGKAFWWDVLYRERRRRGGAWQAYVKELAALRTRGAAAVETYLHAEFGDAALRPVDDTDRPLTPAELKTFAADPLVTIGNHTADHADLGIADADEARAQIRSCQRSLHDLTGTTPQIIAYPNGSYGPSIIDIARSEGLRLGMTVDQRKNRLPLQAGDEMTIGRYFVRGGSPVPAQCRAFRSDVQLRNLRSRLCAR